MSEPAKNDVYFLAVLRYVYLNPLKAGLPDDITSYLWSSYLEYISKLKIVNIAFALNLFNTDRDKAIKEFKKFHALPNNGKCLDIVKNLV